MAGKRDNKKRDGLGVALMWGLLGLVSRFPLGFHLRVFRLVSWFLEKILHYRRDELMINLSRSFPDKKYKELKRIRHQAYVHMGDLMAGSVRFSRYRGKNGPKRFRRRPQAEVLNPELLGELYGSSPSVMVLTGHAGNWELIPAIPEMIASRGGWQLAPEDYIIVYKQLSSHLWDRVIGRNRGCILGKDYEGLTETNHILRYALEHRGDKKVYVFPTDQFPYRGATRHDVGTFMHQPTQAMVGGAAIATKFKMSVVYLRWSVTAREHYTIEFVPIARDASAMTPVDIMKEFYRLLQEDLERQPENYLWTHKRWK